MSNRFPFPVRKRTTRLAAPRLSLLCALTAAVVLPALAGPSATPLTRKAAALGEIQALEGSGRFDEGRVLVKFKPGATEADKQRVMQALGAQGSRGLHRAGLRAGSGEMHAMTIHRRMRVSSAIAQVFDDPAVEDVQPDWMLQLQDTSNDPGFSTLWGVQGANTSPANPYGTGVAELWSKGYNCTSSKPVVVAVLDTGVRTTHEDLRDNIFVNPGEQADGADNDGNGFVDDLKGWNFYAHTNNTEDDHSHGSHVAGTIAAKRNNVLGMAGICGDGGVKILPVKVCSSGGSCPTSAVLEAMSYVTDLKKNRGVNIVAVNLSLGGYSSSPNNTGIEYFQAARDAGIMVAAAAGNNGANTDTGFMWPANLDVNNILSVGNLHYNGSLSSSSNYGTTSVDIAAPGSSIYSTVIGSDSAYNWKSGTSMASPHVAGAIALYRVLHPNATVDETRNGILSTAAVEPSLNGKVAGSRRLDLSHWTWNTVTTTFMPSCGLNATGTGFWFKTGVFTDSTMKAPARYLGITIKGFDPSGKLLNTFEGRTNGNGYVLWAFNRSAEPWGRNFTVTIDTADGAHQSYGSAELNCYK